MKKWFDSILKIFTYSVDTYISNIGLFVLSSIPLFLNYFIIQKIEKPTFPAMGGIFLRISSANEINRYEIIVMSLLFLFSIFVLSFTTALITLIIKAKRQNISIKSIFIEKIKEYTFEIFGILILFELLIFVGDLISYHLSSTHVLKPLLDFVISLGFLYAPYSIVLSETKDFESMKNSFFTLALRLKETIAYFLFIFGLMFIIQILFLNSIIQIILINMLIVPLSIIVLSQIYLSRYSIIY